MVNVKNTNTIKSESRKLCICFLYRVGHLNISINLTIGLVLDSWLREFDNIWVDFPWVSCKFNDLIAECYNGGTYEQDTYRNLFPNVITAD